MRVLSWAVGGSKFTENKRYWHTCKVKCADGSNNCPLLQVNGSLLFVCLQTFLVWYIILLLSMQKCHCHANSWSSNKMPVQNAWRQWLFSYFFFHFIWLKYFPLGINSSHLYWFTSRFPYLPCNLVPWVILIDILFQSKIFAFKAQQEGARCVWGGMSWMFSGELGSWK